MPKRIALLTVLLLTACRPDQAGGGGDVTWPTGALNAPAKVTGLHATRSSTGVRLAWKTSQGAQGYEVYREATVIPNAPLMAASLHTLQRTPFRHAARVPGVRIGSAKKTTFNDTAVDEGYRYTYRVVAFNPEGDAPASDPATINVLPTVLTNWVAGWLQAADNSGSGWDAAIGTVGGNAGVTATTAFADVAAVFTGCAQLGAGITAVRPAIDTLLPDAPQTFALDLTFNTGGAAWSYVVLALGSGSDYTPIYYDEGLFNGCDEKTFAFTVDTAHVPQDELWLLIQVDDEVGDTVYWDLWIYRSFDGSWVRITNTTPARNSLLTTAGNIDVNLEYYNVVTQSIAVSLRPPWDLGVTFGKAVTQVAGTGTVTLSVPYHVVCGFTIAWLSLETDVDVVSPNYGYAVTSTDTHQLLAFSEGWVHRGYPYFMTAMWALKCGGEDTVTLTAPPGWQFGWMDPNTWETVWAQSVTAPAGIFGVRAEGNFLATLPYGSSSSFMTAAFSGNTITASVKVNVYELFWQTAPPATAEGDAAFAVAVTIAGPRPHDSVFVNVMNDRFPLLWDTEGQTFAGEVSYPTCGIFDNTITDYEGYRSDILGGNEWDNSYATVVSTASRLMVQLDDWINFHAAYGEIGPEEIPLREGCNKPFHWQIIGAPAWLRFEALAGTEEALPRMGLLTSVAFATDDYAYGTVEVKIVETGQVLEVDVGAWH